MNTASATRSDASTSTDDVKGRPLCLFYFTHPFGVLSPEAPRVFDMESAPPFCWPSASESSGAPTRAGARRHDAWYTPAGAGAGACCPSGRRYARILPPLRLPSPRDLLDYSSDDVWPCPPRRSRRPRFSLPPIELPVPALPPPAPPTPPPAPGTPRARRSRPFPSGAGVDKHRRRHRRRRHRAADLRRLLTRLIRRTITEGRVCGESSASASVSTSVSPAPALRRALHTLRDAWAPPRPGPALGPSLGPYTYRSAMCSKKPDTSEVPRNTETVVMYGVPVYGGGVGGTVGRGDASPGLLRRRYSVPETIMRKYRLAQQCSESEGATSCARHSAGSGGAARDLTDSPHRDRFMRRDRELMRKSALLRRLGARPTACCCCCESRSLTGSRSELRRSPLVWSSPERRRIERRSALALAASAAGADSTFRSHAEDAGDGCSCTDAFTDTEISEAGPTAAPPLLSGDRSYTDSDPFSTSMSTAKEAAVPPPGGPGGPGGQVSPRCERFIEESMERRAFDRSTYVNGDDRKPVPYDRPLAVDTTTPPYELLEIVVSETMTTGGGAPAGPLAPPSASTLHDLDIDRYVSNILVESLNSLTDQLECMNASMGADRKINIVEKEIKVRLQNTGVNTIVHLSPTSNNQIIFGNEELCNDTTTTMTLTTIDRDECNNPLIRDEAESNDNDTPPPPTGAAPTPPPPAVAGGPPVFDALQHDDVNEAVLQQIQKLFRDELRHLDDEDRLEYGRAADAISHFQISNVIDVFVDERADLIGGTGVGVGLGAGNYFYDSRDAAHAVVPRFSAFPHTESMEVNTSSSEDAEFAGSECTSLVDSLEDPNSPRVAGAGGATSPRRRALVRSAIDVLDLLPERAAVTPPPTSPPPPPPPRDKPEAFFVRIEDDRLDPDPDDVTVAEYMPEKIKQRLYRRHRKRELRMECARRGKNQMKREMEQQRREDAAAEVRRRLERECRALVDDLIDDVIARLVHDEYKCMRIKRRNRLQAAKSEETLSRRTRKITLENRRTSLETAIDDRRRRLPEPGGDRSTRNGDRSARDGDQSVRDGDVHRTEKHQIHGKLLARPSASIASSSRPPRRFYQKSEIHEGDKCIEILEILEYVNGSQSSPETTNSDESHGRGSRSKKSRIPVPVSERSHRSMGSDHMRLTGGDGRDGRRTPADPRDEALAELLLEARSLSRSRSDSLRFKRVFDIIPEERSSLSLESSASCEEGARRSAATSPPAPPQPRPLREQTTMTSPCNKSAGTSPMRPPPPPREGYREVGVGPIESSSVGAAGAAGVVLRRESGGEEKIDEMRGEERRRVEAGREEPVETRDGSMDRRRRAACRVDRGPPGLEGDSSDSGDSGGSLLCSLAPRWLSTQARRDRRRMRRPPPPPSPPHSLPAAAAPAVDPAPALAPAPAHAHAGADAHQQTGGWSVTVAGTCRAALPHDVEMRLRFPHDQQERSPRASRAAPRCTCVQCAACAALPPPHPHHDPTLTLTMKKEAQDSSIVASKTCRSRTSRSRSRSRPDRSGAEHLPELETYRASRTKVKSSMKTRRAYSLHCWLPDDEPAPIRGSSGLSVLGCAIIPELKPRVPTMSERDLTRVYTPRHYLRS